jgi:LysR family transcriptional regulator, glycine cleavage system transcriptional activator
MTQATHLRSLQAIELAIRTGSLKAAGERLKITPAAVGQRIKLLEDYLGVDLLVRRRTGIAPTRALEAALPHLIAAFREVDTVAQLLDFQRMHELQIVADSDWAELWLLPRLPQFRQTHPNTRFCVNGVGDVPVRLGQADCEIWFGAPRAGAHEHFLFRDYLAPIGSPENTLRTSKVPGDVRLEGFPLLHLNCYNGDPDAMSWPKWIERFGSRKTAPGRGIRYQRVAHALEAVYSNAGLIICGLALTEQGRVEKRLSLPFPISHGAWTGHAYRVNFREGSLKRTQTVQFRDWLLEEAGATETRLRGLTKAV